jgi:hypothetical protein
LYTRKIEEETKIDKLAFLFFLKKLEERIKEIMNIQVI